MTVSASLFEPKGRTLVVGATGFIGQFVSVASIDLGHPTFVLVRPGTLSPSKAKIVKAFQDRGATILQGSICDKESMVKILKEIQIEVLISAVGGDSILDQLMLVEAIKEVPTVKRFLPSEFGHDVDRANPVQPGLQMYLEKRVVRRATEEAGIPYTYICCNSIASWPYYDNTHPSEVTPPMDRFQIYGDGTVKAYFVAGPDIGRLTMKTVDDPRAANKMVHFQPACNYLNINELASLWERKIEKTLPRVTVTEDDLLAAAAENIIPESIVASFTHDIFIKGCQVDFSIDGPNEVEISDLYPRESYITVDEWFNQYLVDDVDAAADQNKENNSTVININNNNNNATHTYPKLQAGGGSSGSDVGVNNAAETAEKKAGMTTATNQRPVVEVLPVPAVC